MDHNPQIRDRFTEICPVVNLEDLSIIDAEKDVGIAFKIIGFKPSNFEEAFEKAWRTSNAYRLDEFVYDVWRECDGF